MKSFLGVFIGFFCLLMIVSCSEHIPNEHEQLYLETTDSLRKYKDVPYMIGILKKSDEMRDHLKLDFDEFKKKHNLTDSEMEMADAIYSVHIDVARQMESRDLNR